MPSMYLHYAVNLIVHYRPHFTQILRLGAHRHNIGISGLFLYNACGWAHLHSPTYKGNKSPFVSKVVLCNKLHSQANIHGGEC